MNFPSKKFPGFWETILMMIAFYVVAGTIQAVALLFIVPLFMLSSEDPMALDEILSLLSSSLVVWVTGIGNIIGFAAVIAVGKLIVKDSWKTVLPFTRFPWLLILSLLPLAIGFSILLSEFDNLTRTIVPMPEFLLQSMQMVITSGAASFFVLVIVAPFTEELFFRGLVINGFLSRYSVRTTLLVSSALFALIHLNPFQFAPAFVLGIVLGYIRIKTGSLWPCILFHAFVNGIVFVVSLLPMEIPGYTMTGETSFQPWWFDVTGVVLLLFGGFLTFIFLRGAQNSKESESPTS